MIGSPIPAALEQVREARRLLDGVLGPDRSDVERALGLAQDLEAELVRLSKGSAGE